MGAVWCCILLASVRVASAAPMNDDEIHGYTAAILVREFNARADAVSVSDGVVFIRADLPESDREKLTKALEELDGVARVVIREADIRPVGWAWLPLHAQFKPLLADPRWPHFAASYRYYIDDDLGLTSVGAVDLGETFALARYNFENGGSVELGLQAGVFAIREEDVAESILCGADVDRHLAAIQKFVDAGYDHVYIHQVGPDQSGFLRFYQERILPRLKMDSPR